MNVTELSTKERKKVYAYQIVCMLNSPWTPDSELGKSIMHGLQRMTLIELVNLRSMIEHSPILVLLEDVELNIEEILQRR